MPVVAHELQLSSERIPTWRSILTPRTIDLVGAVQLWVSDNASHLIPHKYGRALFIFVVCPSSRTRLRLTIVERMASSTMVWVMPLERCVLVR